MSCDRLLDTLGAYVRGELDAGEAELVEEHLASCPRCSKEVDQLRRSWELLGLLDEVDPSITSLRAIRERAKLVVGGQGAETRRSSVLQGRSRWARTWWFAAASILLVAAVTTGFWMLGGSPEGPETNSVGPETDIPGAMVAGPTVAMTPIPLPRRAPLYETNPLELRSPATPTTESTDTRVRVVRYSY